MTSSSPSATESASRGASASARSCPRCSPARSRAATAGIDFEHTNVAFMEKPGFLLAIGSVVLVRARAPLRREHVEGRPSAPRSRGIGLGARRAAVRRHAGRRPSLRVSAASIAGLCALRSPRRPRATCSIRVARRLDERRGAALPLYADAASLLVALPGVAGAAALARRARLPGLAAARRAAARRARSTRACASCGSDRAPSPSKLVLAVIDGLKPAMLERARRAGRAPRWRRSWSAAPTSTTASPRSRPSRRSARRRSPPASGPDQHRIPSDELVPPRRAALRRVRLVLRRAARRVGVARSLTDTVYNMNGSAPRAEVPTVFERLDDAGLRTAGTTYLIYRGRHRHQIARRDRAGAARAATSSASPCWARASCSTRTCSRAARPAAARSSGCPAARPAHRLRRRVPGGARPVRLPALLAARQRRLLAPQRPARAGRPRSPHADRQLERLAHAGWRARRVPRRARGDRARRPLARRGRAARRAAARVRGPGTSLAADAAAARATAGADRALPVAALAMVYVLDPERRARARARARASSARRWQASTS